MAKAVRVFRVTGMCCCALKDGAQLDAHRPMAPTMHPIWPPNLLDVYGRGLHCCGITVRDCADLYMGKLSDDFCVMLKCILCWLKSKDRTPPSDGACKDRACRCQPVSHLSEPQVLSP